MSREIKVIANTQNRNETFISESNTLGELKAELKEKGFVVDDMDFKEGKSRVELRDDLSVLPSNFMYRGQETSDLVIMISPKNAKITSGALSEKRQQLYSIIKENNLQEAVVEYTGDSYTRATNDELEHVISTHMAGNTHCPGMDENKVRHIVNEEIDKRGGSEYSVSSLALCILKIISFMESLTIFGKPLVSHDVCKNWRDSIKKDYCQYTSEELEEMDF